MNRDIIIESLRQVSEQLGDERMALAMQSDAFLQGRFKGIRAAKKAAKKARMQKIQRAAFEGEK